MLEGYQRTYKESEQLARDRGYMDVVMTEEAGYFLPKDTYHSSIWRPGIPENIHQEILEIEERSREATGVIACEIIGNVEALRAYGRVAARTTVQQASVVA